jgi:hypothetical protein
MPTKLLRPESKLFRPGIQVSDFRLPELEHEYRNKSIAGMAHAARRVHAHMMPFAQYSEQAVLSSMFGNCVGCVRTAITAAATAQTAINTGSFATGGVSGNMDTTPSGTGVVWIGTGGAGGTKNQYTNPAAFQLTAAAATSLTIASQSVGLARSVGDFIFSMGATAAPLPAWTLNTVYLGLTTQAVSGATQANVLSGEPTSTGSYARVVIPNTAASWPLASAASPSVLTSGAIFNLPASTAAWSTGSTNLIQAFLTDSPTLGGGNVLAFGALGTPQAVNAAGITLSFAIGAFTITLT